MADERTPYVLRGPILDPAHAARVIGLAAVIHYGFAILAVWAGLYLASTEGAFGLPSIMALSVAVAVAALALALHLRKSPAAAMALLGLWMFLLLLWLLSLIGLIKAAVTYLLSGDAPVLQVLLSLFAPVSPLLFYLAFLWMALRSLRAARFLKQEEAASASGPTATL